MKYLFVIIALGSFIFLITDTTDTSQDIFENISIELFFCPEDNCTHIMLKTISQTTHSLYCAFYDFTQQDIQEQMHTLYTEGKNVKLVAHTTTYNADIPTVIRGGRGLMHHKFCVIDEKIVLTASANPTPKELTQNDNNMLVIHSIYLAQNFIQEFEEMFYEQSFRGGSFAKHPIIIYENSKSIETLFCPQSFCENRIIELIEEAQTSIEFYAFTFTSFPIANELIIASHNNVTVRGIFERRQRSQYWQFERVSPYIEVFLFQSPVVGGILHQKAFLFDDTTLLLGSYNPTAAANTINDEVILIITDEAIIQTFKNHFQRSWTQRVLRE